MIAIALREWRASSYRNNYSDIWNASSETLSCLFLLCCSWMWRTAFQSQLIKGSVEASKMAQQVKMLPVQARLIRELKVEGERSNSWTLSAAYKHTRPRACTHLDSHMDRGHKSDNNKYNFKKIKAQQNEQCGAVSWVTVPGASGACFPVSAGSVFLGYDLTVTMGFFHF